MYSGTLQTGRSKDAIKYRSTRQRKIIGGACIVLSRTAPLFQGRPAPNQSLPGEHMAGCPRFWGLRDGGKSLSSRLLTFRFEPPFDDIAHHPRNRRDQHRMQLRVTKEDRQGPTTTYYRRIRRMAYARGDTLSAHKVCSVVRQRNVC